jgi:succinate dehydrogenase/fumarate reductase cytochrome b subunit
MINPLSDFEDKIVQFVVNVGIDPIYFSTCICILILVMRKEKIKNWKDLDRHKKISLAVNIYIVIMLSIVSIGHMIIIK